MAIARMLRPIVEEDRMNGKIIRLVWIATATSIASASAALAQAPVSSPTPPVALQLPETRGTVERFTLTPIGELDGVILADGTEVHLPPHLTAQLASAVRVGDTVTVQGYRSAYVPLVVAASITDVATGQTVVDSGTPPPGSRPPPPPPGMPRRGRNRLRPRARCNDNCTGR